MNRMDILLVIFSIFLPLSVSEKPLLKTKLGLIRGLEAKDGDYFMFLGIPYAKVNESNPFGESLPQPPFERVFEAYDDTVMCPQKEEFNNTFQGSINCLTVNIYVPKTANRTNKLPILLYIYGGNYRIGWSGRYVYGPKYLVRHDIVLVTFNYRVGPYGFLCLNIPEVPGNQGFKDQKAALRWVYNNIEDFGGDRNKITLDGHSFGAESIDYILHSMSEDERLIDKVIIQSASNLKTYPVINKVKHHGVLELAKYLGYKTNDVRDAVKFLSSVNSSSVIQASLDFYIEYGFCLEPDFNNVSKFLPDYRWNLKVPAAKNISFMVGHTDREMLFITGLDIPLDIKFLNPITVTFKHFNLTESEIKELSKIIHNFYKVNETFSISMKDDFVKHGSDFYYFHSARSNMLKYIENGAKVVYYYMFTYDGGRNFMKRNLNLSTEVGATHGDEITYLYDASYMDEPSPDDQLIIDRMTTLWTNFVKYGNPTPYKTNLLPEKWKPYSKKHQNYLEIDKAMSCKSMAENKAVGFWDLFNGIYGNRIIDYLHN